MFRIEMNRLLRSKRLYAALLAGGGLALWHFFQWVLPIPYLWEKMAEYNKGGTIASTYEYWMGSSTFPLPGFLFLMVLPILAVMPYGMTYDNDRKSGWMKNVYVRAERRSYMRVKLGLSFVSGMLVVMFPLLLNFMLTAMILPLKEPQLFFGVVGNRNIWCNLFYQHPMCYVALVSLLNGIYGGLMSMLAVLLSHSTDYGFLVGIMPFLYHMFLFSLCNLLGCSEYAPARFLSGGVSVNYYTEYIIVGILSLFVFFMAYRKGTRSDVY